MAERPPFESPIVSSYEQTDADHTVSDVSSLTKHVVRADERSAAADRLGVGFGESRLDRDALICGSRPGEWLVIGPEAAVGRVTDRLDASDTVSVVELTHGRALCRLTGPAAPSTLEKVCSLDLSDRMTPDGAVTSGSVAKVTCDLVRNDVDGVPSYLIACDRSFGQYLFDAILDAGAEFMVEVGISGSTR